MAAEIDAHVSELGDLWHEVGAGFDQRRPCQSSVANSAVQPLGAISAEQR
jgi:hypothetical protein